MATMTALATVTVGAGGAANIEFTNIPQTYTDLLLKTSIRNVNDTPSCWLRFNSATTNFSDRWVYGTGVGALSTTNSNIDFLNGRSSFTANTFGNSELYIPNYAGSNNKSVSVDSVAEDNATVAYTQLSAGLWSNTAAITSIQILASTGNIAQYSTATLYGVFRGPETLPTTPTIGTATATGGTTATVAFTPTSATGVDASYTALSSPGSITATGTSSPVTVSGLTTGTAYTFQVRANNPGGSSAYSSASNSVTPDIGDFISLSTATVGSGGSASITFSSIPQTYSHLQIRGITRNGSADNKVIVEFNSDTTPTNYWQHAFYGSGSGAGTGWSYNNNWINYSAETSVSAGIFGPFVIDIYDYAATDKSKTLKILGGFDNNGSGYAWRQSLLWTNTAAISAITFKDAGGGNFAQHTTYALYGIKG